MSCPTLPLLLPMITIPGLKGNVFTTFCSIGAGHHKSMKFYLIIKSFLNIFYLANTFSRTEGKTLRRGKICYRTQCRRPSCNEWTAVFPVACRLVHCRQVEDMRNLNKKSFSFFTITPSQSGWKPLFIGGSVVRVRVRV